MFSFAAGVAEERRGENFFMEAGGGQGSGGKGDRALTASAWAKFVAGYGDNQEEVVYSTRSRGADTLG